MKEHSLKCVGSKIKIISGDAETMRDEFYRKEWLKDCKTVDEVIAVLEERGDGYKATLLRRLDFLFSVQQKFWAVNGEVIHDDDSHVIREFLDLEYKILAKECEFYADVANDIRVMEKKQQELLREEE